MGVHMVKAFGPFLVVPFLDVFAVFFGEPKSPKAPQAPAPQ